MQCPRCGGNLPAGGPCPVCGWVGEQLGQQGQEPISGRADAPTPLEFPDPCETPAAPAPEVPVPYPETARSSDHSPPPVKVEGRDAVVKGDGFPATTGDESGTAGPGWAAGGLPGGVDTLLVVGAAIAMIAVVLVTTGDVGWTESQVWLFPPGELEPETPTVTTVKHSYGVADGGLHAVVVVAIAIMLVLAAVAVLVAVARPRRARLLVFAGLALAAGALVVSVAGGLAFNSWAEDEGFTDNGAGSSIWAGIVGSVMVMAVLAVRVAWPGRAP